jgi:hypothetical protein
MLLQPKILLNLVHLALKMILDYSGFVNVSLNKKDLNILLSGKNLSENMVGSHNNTYLRVTIAPSEEKFYSGGSLGESFDKDIFNGWCLEPPRKMTQLAFPWGDEDDLTDYHDLRVRVSVPVLIESLANGDYLSGMTRGMGSGNIIDRLHLNIFNN